MCGITGVISAKAIDLTVVQKMNQRLVHRGPDDFGYVCSQGNHHQDQIEQVQVLEHFSEPYFALAHRRLAIHDLSAAGHQPMSFQDRYWIVFNGEIYNFVELRAELMAHHYTFKSQTDTEVILAAYDHWGAECLKKFNGDWALVLIDTFKNKILIARDRFGVKPLYYFAKPGLFCFASEIKALLEYPGITKAPNIDYLKTYLKLGAQEHLKETAFKEIYHFEAAGYFEDDLGALIQAPMLQLKKYWSLQPNLSTEKLNPEQLKVYAQEYYALLEDAVKLRLRADVKVGSSLSGGLDSSVIAYLIKQQQQNLQVFSSIFSTLGTTYCDESEFIKATVGALNLESIQFEPNARDLPAAHRDMIYYLDTPPDSLLMASWHIYQLEHRFGIKVTVDGQGADEQLAGYLSYLSYYFANMNFFELYKNYRAFTCIPYARRYLCIGVLMNFMKRICGKKLAQYLYQKITHRSEQLFTPLNKKLHESLGFPLSNYLQWDDRTAMAHSVEIRMPFMDYRLVEFLARVPARYKLAHGTTKYLARYAFNGRLPEKVIWRRDKCGWNSPDNFWLEGEYKSWLENKIKNSAFLAQQKFYVPRAFASLKTLYKIRLLNIAVWYEVFF
jgi:asparagine synthase (glutamine-hydrolysing)